MKYIKSIKLQLPVRTLIQLWVENTLSNDGVMMALTVASWIFPSCLSLPTQLSNSTALMDWSPKHLLPPLCCQISETPLLLALQPLSPPVLSLRSQNLSPFYGRMWPVGQNPTNSLLQGGNWEWLWNHASWKLLDHKPWRLQWLSRRSPAIPSILSDLSPESPPRISPMAFAWPLYSAWSRRQLAPMRAEKWVAEELRCWVGVAVDLMWKSFGIWFQTGRPQMEQR